MNKTKNFYLQLDYITDYGKQRTKYFCSKLSLLRFVDDSNAFTVSIYDFNKHEYIFKCSEKDLFTKKMLLYLIKLNKE